MTRTYATLEVSAPAYDEIARKLLEAGYDQAFHGNGIDPFDDIDMHGIALTRGPSAPIEQILDAIQAMGVPELSRLLDALKEKFGV